MAHETPNEKETAPGGRAASAVERLVNCDHEWELIDESFDHEFGTEQRYHYECSKCGQVDDLRTLEPEYFDDDVI